MESKKLLGIDYGARRVGVAVSDDAASIAFPREPLENNDALIKNLVEMAKKEEIKRIIVGDARSFSGKDNPITAEVEEFIAKLTENTGLQVEGAWEAGSSIEASRYAPKGHEHEDSSAAAIILQRFIDMHEGTGVQ